MRGDTTLFTRAEASELAWKIVDPVLEAAPKVHEYEPGTWGPEKAAARIAPPDGWADPVA
jgi:glucose-6-phosphate 1-dehydrogenase